MELRPYQAEAVSAIESEWAKGVRSTLAVLPTGCGKTILFCKVTENAVRRWQRVLILAHRGELLDQAADKLYKMTGLRASVEKAEQSSLDSWFMVTVGSVQTMAQPKRLEQFEEDHFGVIIVDECHHALAATYQRVLQHFKAAKVLGVTATPDRGDMQSLGQFFETLAYQYTLPTAIKEHYLCPIKAYTIPLKLDISGVRIQNGDFRASDLSSALDPYLDQIAEEMKRYCMDRRTVVFLPLIATSKKFCRILNKIGFHAEEVNGGSDDRQQVLERFSSGTTNVLCNSMLLTEGWDCPPVDCVIVLRPTKTRSLYAQMVGRGTRMSPETGKQFLLLLDFLWHTTSMNLCRPASLICESSDVADKMTANIQAAKEPVDLEAAEQEAAKDVVEERESALADKLKKMTARKRKLVDPIQFYMSIQEESLVNYTPAFGWEQEPITDAQRERLEKSGIYPDEVKTRGEASKIIDSLKMRAMLNLTTPKQIRFLERRGFCHVGKWPFEAAKALIDRIAANGWKTPYNIGDPETYYERAVLPTIQSGKQGDGTSWPTTTWT